MIRMALQGRDAHNLFNQMTKKEALSAFRVLYKKKFSQTYRPGDTIAKRTEWNDFTDHLCKQGLITSKQYDTWGQPF